MIRAGFAAIVLCLCCGLYLCASPSPAVAAGPHTKLQLVSEVATIEPGRNLDLGLFFDLEPRWHIYWVNPGDSGEPPSVTWSLPTGFQATGLEWPVPERLVNGPLTDYGYQGRVLLIAPVRAPSVIKDQTVTFSAEVHWLVCSDVCIPGKASVSVDLPVQRAAPHSVAKTRELFHDTLRRLPQPLPPGWRVSVEDRGNIFRIRVSAGTKFRQAGFFPLDFNQLENSKPQTSVPLPGGVEVSVYKSDQLLQPLRQIRGVLVIDGGRAYQVTAPVKAG